MKKLIFVESPTKARTIKKILKEAEVVATYGHLIDLPEKEFGLYLDKKGKILAKYLPLKKKGKIIKKIKSIIKNFKEIYLATDPDREGEMIAEEIRILTKNNFKRIIFYEITPKAIFEALKNPTKIRENLVSAQKGRRYLDRIFGYLISPVLWKEKIGISAGRVQSAVLKLIVEREREIRNFKKEKYYLVFVKAGGLEFVLVEKNLRPVKIKIEEKNEWLEKLENLKEIEIKDILEKEKLIFPPLPLDTENLQRFAFQFLKFPPKKTMFTAQKLFELGKITYHRTDSHKISPEFSYKLKELIEKEFSEDYFSFPRKLKEKLSFEAHEAIRPTSLQAENLTQDYLKLWKLIFLITLASHFKPAKYKEIKIIAEKNNFLFLAQVNKLLFDGFLKIWPQKLIKFQELPKIKIKDLLKIEKIEFKLQETRPPSRYTETSLIKEMKRLGIGRPSTYVQIIEILKKRNYVKKIKNYLVPTEIGEKVYHFLNTHFPDLIDLKFTAKMEEVLDEIALGKKNYEEFVINFWKELEKRIKYNLP